MINTAATYYLHHSGENIMMSLTNTTSSLFQPKEANELAVKLNGNVDDDWVYVVHHDPTGKGYSFIKIYDEDGEFVSKL